MMLSRSFIFIFVVSTLIFVRSNILNAGDSTLSPEQTSSLLARKTLLVRELMDRFISKNDVRRLLYLDLGKNLDEITENHPLPKIWEDVLTWAVRERRLEDLLKQCERNNSAFKSSQWMDVLILQDHPHLVQNMTSGKKDERVFSAKANALLDELMDRFPSRSDLKFLLRFELNAKIDEITGNHPLKKTWEDVLTWAVAEHGLKKLLDACAARNPAFKPAYWAHITSIYEGSCAEILGDKITNRE